MSFFAGIKSFTSPHFLSLRSVGYQKLINLPYSEISLSRLEDPFGIDVFFSPDRAYIELGQMFLDPIYNAMNGTLAEEYLNKAWDEGGYIDAALELGKGYLSGTVLIRNEATAFNWFSRAYASVNIDGLSEYEEEVYFWLSHCHEMGIGTTRCPALAFNLYKSNADLGDVWAQLKVAQYFQAGLGVPRDYQQAYFWANVAAAYGDEKAAELRDELESKLTKSQIAESQRAAAKWNPKTE